MSAPAYFSALRKIQKSAQETLNTIHQRHPQPRIKTFQRSPIQVDIPRLRLQFPDDLSDLIASMELSQDTTRQLSDCLQKWYLSIVELQTKRYKQTCEDILPCLSNDGAVRTIESLRLSYETVYIKDIVPRVRSQILNMKECNLVPTRGRFNSKFVPILEEFFSLNAYPTAKEREQLARKSKMSSRQIEVWFQNHRRRAKQEGRPISRKTSRSPTLLAGEIPELVFTEDDTSSTDDNSWDDEVVMQKSLCRNTKLCTFAYIRPPHAFPTIFPPIGTPDPFPHENGIFKFPPPVWQRKPATYLPPYSSVDMDVLAQMFTSKLNLRGQYNSARPSYSKPRSYQPWFASRTTTTPRAPLVALVRNSLMTNNFTSASQLHSALASYSPPLLFGSTSCPVAPVQKSKTCRWPSMCVGDIAKSPSSPMSSSLPTLGDRTRSRLSSSSSSSSSAGPETPPMSPIDPPLEHNLDDFQLLDQYFYDPSQLEKDFIIPPSSYGILT